MYVWFYISLTVHLGIILVNNQLDALFSMYLFISLLCMFRAIQCSSSGESIVSVNHLVCITLLIIRRIELYQYIIWHVSLCSSSGESNCINTSSGMYHSVYVTAWYAGPSGPAYQAVTYTEWYMPDDVLIQLILLMMSTGLLETCREVK